MTAQALGGLTGKMTTPSDISVNANRRFARHLDLQNEQPGRVPNRALCAFVKSVAVCCRRPVGDAHLLLPFRC
jgi:hypothetical protein